MRASSVFIVESDVHERRNLALLLQTEHLNTVSFCNANDFLLACGLDPSGCLILDLDMPGMNGLQLQDELVLRNIALPIIFVTRLVNIKNIVMGMRKGAVDFMAKPVDTELLLRLVHSALQTNREQRVASAARAQFKARLLDLSPREREVLALALSGMPNKLIARAMSISVRTIEGHRVRIYLKLGLDSLLGLAQQAASVEMPLADIATWQPK